MRGIDLDFPRPTRVSAGPAPILMWIDISKLVIDDTYQRELKVKNRRTVSRIAEHFDWAKFSCVHVAPIEGGLYAIIDGQHRTHAAAACGFESVPCLVVHMDVRQQAASFAAINGMSTAVTPFHIYKAALAADEGWALGVRDAVTAAGCELMTYNKSEQEKRPGEVYCLRFVRDTFERHGHDSFVAALRIVRVADGLGDTPEAFSHGFLRPVMQALLSRPHAMRREKEVISLLGRTDLWEVAEKAGRLVADRRRRNLPAQTKVECFEMLIVEILDAVLPTRISMTAPRTEPVLKDLSSLVPAE